VSKKQTRSIAEALDEAVLRLGTQKAVADALGVSASMVNRWLMGIVPAPEAWNDLMKLFGVGREEFAMMLLRTGELRAGVREAMRDGGRG
jgi:hypothetical protein